MRMRAAVIDQAGVVVNVVMVDEDAEYDPGEWLQLVVLDEETALVSPGWTYNGDTWIEPVPGEPEPEPMTTEAWLQQQINDLTDLILFG